MDILYQFAWIIPLLPLCGAIIVGIGLILFNKSTNSLRRVNAIFLISAVAMAMVFASALLWSQIQGHEAYTQTIEWATADNFRLRVGYTIDALSSLMLVVVTAVAFLVTIYTDGYMARDPGYVRFYVYLSIFSSSMLGLVVSSNLLQIYIFWELVGMCSYLLIGFWYDRPAAAAACQKAFVTNRIGDFGFLLGMLGLYWATDSFDFGIMGSRLQELTASGTLSTGLAALLAIALFLGPVAKSAQFPLHVWLPDAMEGPTPISALIHAATMVAAGIFLIARMYPVFESIPVAMEVIAWTGAITALLGAAIALTQNDLKKALAYSTVSQLGYMVMAMGIGAYSAGLFHLTTHACFKAMLFLCSGSVIHGMEAVVGHDPALAQDMRLMGGLRKHMPVTATTFFIGTLAICGVPPLAGFWSKDEILGFAFSANPVLWSIGWLTAGLTAFYMFRIYFMTFEGEFRGTILLSKGGGHEKYPHESPLTMTLPLIVLAIPACFLGWFGRPWNNSFASLIHAPGEIITASHFELQEFLIMAGSSVGVATIGITLASLMYLQHKIDPESIGDRYPALYQLSLNKMYFDDFYHAVFVVGCRRLARQVMEVDRMVIDGAVNLTAIIAIASGEGGKYLETGRAQFYTLTIFAAILSLTLLFTLNPSNIFPL